MRFFSLLLVVVVAFATSCTLFMPHGAPVVVAPKPESPKVETPKTDASRTDFPPAMNDGEALIQYAAYLRRLGPADLNREHDTVKQLVAKNKSDMSRTQLAMVYALPGLPTHDDAKALAILDSLGKEATAPTIRNFALLLLSLVADNRRLDENVQTLNGKLRDEQKQSAELQQKLEALKSIEKSLSDRDRGRPSAPKK